MLLETIETEVPRGLDHLIGIKVFQGYGEGRKTKLCFIVCSRPDFLAILHNTRQSQIDVCANIPDYYDEMDDY